MKLIRLFLCLGFSSLFFSTQAQWVTHRTEEFSSPQSNLRTFPCAGITRYEEAFEGLNGNLLPTDWSMLDLDTLPPNPNISYLQKGWQPIPDFKDSTNTAMASPSWYAQPDTSEDWLITKKITLGDNTCMSWYAYSQDIYYPEKYEVRISTTTTDTAAFLVDTALSVINSEFYSLNYRSVNLSKYKNQDVYLAFRQRSVDKFILVLDNVRFADVQKKDVAMFSVNTPLYADTAKVVTFKGSVINYGSDTVSIDSGVFKIHYRLNNGSIETMPFRKSYKIAPNDTLNWVHDSTWTTPKVFQVYNFATWFTGLSGQPLSNDTLKAQFGIYPTDIQGQIPRGAIVLYPNPVESILSVSAQPVYEISTASCVDIWGQKVGVSILPKDEGYEIQANHLPSGIYFLHLQDKNGKNWAGKFIKQ